MNRGRTFVALAATAAVLSLLGLRLRSTRSAAPAAAERGMRVPAGEASPPSAADRLAAAAPDPVAAGPVAAPIPARLPPFTLAGLDGRPTPISAFAHRSLIINFWAPWCAPCRREIPLLRTIDRQWRARQVSVIGIAVDARAAVARYAHAAGIDYPLLTGEQDALDVAAKLGVATPAFPFTVFTDARGRIVAVYLGELHRPQIDLILGVVQRLNTARIALPAARRAIDAGLDRLRSATATG
jgi:thiol-disulfide isomerase/thioredoxin